jgi:hypothetical protein
VSKVAIVLFFATFEGGDCFPPPPHRRRRSAAAPSGAQGRRRFRTSVAGALRALMSYRSSMLHLPAMFAIHRLEDGALVVAPDCDPRRPLWRRYGVDLARGRRAARDRSPAGRIVRLSRVSPPRLLNRRLCQPAR